MEQEMKQVPYGVSDFEAVMTQNLYYVDKTMFIPLLEQQPRYQFFSRPRRFGKSLFLNMLCAYYDCNLADKFDTLFGRLWIGSHPTPLKNHYQVLRLDFSQVGGSIDEIKVNFDDYCNEILDGFVKKYIHYYSEDFYKRILSIKNTGRKITAITNEAHDYGYALTLSSTSTTTSRISSSTKRARQSITPSPMPTVSIATCSEVQGAPRVEALRQGTTLHKIIIQFEGFELRRMKEV